MKTMLRAIPIKIHGNDSPNSDVWATKINSENAIAEVMNLLAKENRTGIAVRHWQIIPFSITEFLFVAEVEIGHSG